jgi:histone H1/5
MSDAVQQQAAPVKVAKQAKKPAASKPKAAAKHPKFREMILEAIKKLGERSGSSRQAIVKYVVSNFAVDEKAANQHTKLALKAGVKQGWLKQAKGVGASGSFRIGEAAKAAPKKVVKKVAPKPKTAKPKVAKASSKPKKNVKKVVKPKAPKPASAATPAAAPAAPAAKPAAPSKKAAPAKKVVKKAAPAAKPAKAVAKKAVPAKKAAPAKKPAAPKKPAAKKTVKA